MEGEGERRKCSKKFPKDYMEETVLGEDHYPRYRRRSEDQGGHHYMLRINDDMVRVDNRYVVPYNPTLLLKYQAHINVESVHCLSAIKYIFKYITKVSTFFNSLKTPWPYF